MKPFKIPAGAKVLLGAPAQPMPKYILDAIRTAVSEVTEVIEAHLRQCFVQDEMDAPAQVLVLVVESRMNIGGVLDSLERRLSAVLPKGTYLDIWPIERLHPSLAAVRNSNCRVY